MEIDLKIQNMSEFRGERERGCERKAKRDGGRETPIYRKEEE